MIELFFGNVGGYFNSGWSTGTLRLYRELVCDAPDPEAIGGVG